MPKARSRNGNGAENALQVAMAMTIDWMDRWNGKPGVAASSNKVKILRFLYNQIGMVENGIVDNQPRGGYFINFFDRSTLMQVFGIGICVETSSSTRIRRSTEISLVAIAFSVVCKVSIEFSSGIKMQQLELFAVFEKRSSTK